MENSQYIFFLILFGSLLIIVIVFAFLSFILIYRQKVLKHKMEMKEGLLRARVEVQEESLKLLASEIHDNVAQVLTMSRMLLSNSLSYEPMNKKSKKFIDQGLDLLNRSIEDLRNLSHRLSSNTIEQYGLLPAIEEELVYIRSLYHLKCNFSFPGESELPDFSCIHKIFIFRIVQETIQNIIKHAKASAVDININCHDGNFELIIKDNGIGIGRMDEIQSGLGLVNMRERANLMGAEFSITSKPGQGSEVSLFKNISNENDKV